MGLPERLAMEVADRVSCRVEEGWTSEKVIQEVSVELRNLYEIIERAYEKFKCSVPMGEHNVGEQRTCNNESISDEKPLAESRIEFKRLETQA